MTKPRTYVNSPFQSYTCICTKFCDFSLKNEPSNAKKAWLIKRSIMCIFNETEPPYLQLVRDLRAMNVFAKFENDPWKITDVRALTGLDRPAAPSGEDRAEDNNPEPPRPAG